MRMMLRLRVLVTTALVLGLLVGCSGNPALRSQKYFESGNRYFVGQKYREAAIQFQNALQANPLFVAAHYQLAQCYLKLGNANGAYQELSRTVDLQPDNLQARIDLGNLLFVGRNFEKARENAQFVLEKDPNEPQAYTLLANVDAQLGNLKDSLEEMQKAIDLSPGHSESYLNLAFLQIGAKQPAAAEKSFNRAIQLDPKSLPALLELGKFYGQQRRWTEAENQFRSAILIAPDSPAPRTALAALYLVQARRTEAEQVLREAKNTLGTDPIGYRLLGDFYLSVGDLDKALAEFAYLYQGHPNDVQVKNTYARLLIQHNRLAEAKKLDDEVLGRTPHDSEALINRGQILMIEGKPKDAVPVLNEAVKNAPSNSFGHYLLGVALSLVGNAAQAESEWREATRLQPALIDAQRALALLSVQKGDLQLLEQSSEQLIKAEPMAAEGYDFRAKARFLRRKVAEAEADLQKVIELAPKSPIGYTSLGELRAAQRKFDEAEKLYERALDLDPNAGEALRDLVNLNLFRKQQDKALSRVQAQILKAPNNSAFYSLLGQVLIQKKDPRGAEAALQKAVEIDPNNLNAFFFLSQLEVDRGSAEQAIEGYRRAIQAHPRDLRLYVALGSLQEKLGNWQEAEHLYQSALAIEPNYPVAANNLAFLMLEHGGDTVVALSLAQTARRGLPELPNTADTLGWAYFKSGAYGPAVNLLQETVKNVPENASYHYHLGLAYQMMKDHGHAKEELERALQLTDPKAPGADQIRRALAEING
jgi:tetratricopeptide (TPR) repeat protein